MLTPLCKWSTLAFLGAMLPVGWTAHVYYHLDLTWSQGAPNGVKREMAFVNGKFPGPLLEMDEGDDITVDVTNHLPFNTSIHFHGIEQKGTPWSDGVSGLTQWAIQPGKNYRYQWHANTYGTFWYHAHDKSAIMDGLYGGIRIRPSPDQPTPFSMISNDSNDLAAMKQAERNGKAMVISDWHHMTSDEYMNAMEETGYDIFCSDSILINGQGSVYCRDPDVLTSMMPSSVQNLVNSTVTDKGCIPFVQNLQGSWEHHPEKLPPGINSGCQPSTGSEAVFHVDPSARWMSFHIISAASLKVPVVSIDEHPMYVYEVDGRYIEPQLVHALRMYNGERYSVMVKLDKEPANYRIRVPNDATNQVISGFATLSYAGGQDNPRQSEPYVNYGSESIKESVVKLDADHLIPYPPIQPAPIADDFHLLSLGRINSSWEWTLDGVTFFPASLSDMEPVIFDPQSPELASALKIATRNNTWVDIVYQLRIQPPLVVQPPHPIHKHSNRAFLMGRGSGEFQWGSVNEAIKASPEDFFEQPVYRDTFVTLSPGENWVAIRYHVVNPGPFFLHCHMETHLFSGMGMVLLDGVDAWPAVPPQNHC